MAAAGRKLGDAYIAVTADATGVGNDLSKKASKALEDAARKMGATLDDGLDQAVTDATDGLGDGVSDELEKSTERAGGKFAAGLRKHLDKALTDLPDVTLGADASSVDQTLAGVREQLSLLRDSNIGVDVSTADALASIDRLKAQLVELSSSDADVQVRTDTAAAAAALAALQAQVARLDGKNVRINADSSGVDAIAGHAGRASGGLGILISTALAVAPALIPIGAAAVAALGAIGPLAAAGGAGIAAMLIGFSGVGDAVKLLGKRTDTLAQQAAASAGSQVSSAGAIASAQAALANTQANNADAAVKAAERVTRAQEEQATTTADVARRSAAALRTVEEAQLGVVAAIEAAKRQQEDLANSVADNALAQRQSVLDVADAQKALNAVMRNRRATDAMKEGAQLAYDSALQRQAELKLSGERLTAQQQDSAKKGVEGSDLVVAAQQKLLDAQDELTQAQEEGARKVLAAQRAVTDALAEQASQARNAAFSVSQAMAAVTSAGASAGAAGSSALAGIDAELAKVDPATRRFAEYVDGTLKPAWERIKGAAAGGLLPGVQSGLEKLQPILPQVTGFITSMSTTLGGIFDDLGTQLSSPFWVDFFTKLQNVAGPALQDLYDIGMNVVEAIASIVEAFMPMSADMGDGLVGLTQKFADWAAQLGDSQGFKDFVSYVKENGPKVMELLGNLAGIIQTLVTGLAGQGSGTLDFLVNLAGAIADMDPSTLAAVVDAIGGLVIAKSVVGGVGDLVQAGRDARDTYNTVKDTFGKVKDGLSTFVTGVGETATAVGGAVADGASLAAAYGRAAGSAIANGAAIAWAWVSAAGSTALSWASMAATATVNAVRTGAVWIAQTAMATGSMLLSWATTGLTVAASWAGMAAAATINAVKVGAVWLAQTAATTLEVLVGWGIAVATVVGGWVLMGIQATLQAARMAAAWLIAMGPIGWIIAAVVGLVAIVIANWDTIKSHTLKIFGAIGDFVSGVWDGMVSGIKAAINGIIGYINTFTIGGINLLIDGVNLVNPFKDIPHIPKIPKLANGAVVDRATLAVVGEAGPEVVLPLSSAKSARRAQLMEEAGLSGGGGQTIDARQYYEVKDSQTAEEVGAVVGQRVVRDIRNGVSGRYGSGVAA